MSLNESIVQDSALEWFGEARSERRVGGPGLHDVGRVPSRGAVRLLQLIPTGQQHILELEDGKKRWVERMTNSECRTD